jgi:hypothetical protein
MIEVQTLLESILNMFLKSASFINDVFFLVKNKTSGSETTRLKRRNIRISKLSDVRLKEFCCIIFFSYLWSNLLVVSQNFSSSVKGFSGHIELGNTALVDVFCFLSKIKFITV